MKPLVLDFETYYDTNITLTKLSYSEYVPKAPPYLVGILYEGRLYTITGLQEIRDHLQNLPWHEIELVAHNALFDGAILSHWIDRKPLRIACTLSSARALYPSSPHDLKSLSAALRPDLAHKDSNALVATKGRQWTDLTTEEQTALTKYCQHDTLLCAAIYEIMYPQLSQTQKDIINQTHQLWINPVLHFDTTKAEQAIAEELIEERKMLNSLNLTHNEVRSNAIFTRKLLEMGYVIPTKWSTKQNKEVPALAKNDPALQDFVNENPEITKLIELKKRINSNIKQSRTERILSIVNASNGLLPVGYLYHGALTGRFSGTNRCNLQNLPRNSTLRDCITAAPDKTLIVGDFSQIEVRVNAWLNNELKLLDIFKRGEDPYIAFAKIMYHTDTISPEQRQAAKAATLGLGYGMGTNKFLLFAKTMKLNFTPEEAEATVTLYRNTCSQIVAGWRILGQNLYCLDPTKKAVYKGQDFQGKLQLSAEKMRLPSGRCLTYENLHYDDDGNWRYGNNRKLYSSHLMENACQAIASDIHIEAILTVNEHYPVVMHTHDEIILCVPDTEVDQATTALKTAMTARPSWATDLPLDAKIGHGKRYGDAK